MWISGPFVPVLDPWLTFIGPWLICSLFVNHLWTSHGSFWGLCGRIGKRLVGPQKFIRSMRGEEPLDEGLDLGSRLREHVDSKRRGVPERLWYARPTRSSWPLRQGSMGDISQLKGDREHNITTWQTDVDSELIKSAWSAHLRTSEEDEHSEE